ncbi:uncharacterized protein LOC132753907 [Ruditapes philippinarum]|uniref:uncharacterized protein LOC132753907 n=1 Tax=Ruditapes philippinarum TaxID=129788 RepID=UPI00295AB2F5|nr:uncharacterized protein LOC132753907 [Ruditapes philippinarum]
MMSLFTSLIFLVIGLVIYTAAQDQYTARRRPQPGNRPAGGRIPSWCPPGSPRIRCFANPCDVDRCPSFPGAICLNDNPCEPSCSGHFYIEGRSRLSRRECNGGGQNPPGLPAWCPVGSPRIRCFAYPCSVMTCPRYPRAKCLADNPCEPSCSGNFYIRRRGGRVRRLSQAECQGRRGN